MKKWVLPLAMLSLTGLVGCTTQSMKGTPFFFGDYEDREGPPADRFNAWPLVYYRDPALSVLWPLMEFSPEHQAVRPIYSADGLGSNYPEYNVVWPIARFAPGKQKYRIFPVFWGDDYLNVFPLYWHEGEPWSGTGHDALFPLWIWSNRTSGDSLYVAWPFYARHRSEDENAWYLWPLYGQKKSKDSVSRSVAWPLIHMYSSPSQSGSWAFPLYGYDRNDSRTSFYSLPYSRSVSENGKSWDLALPLWYRNWLGDARSWALFPALSWGNKDADQVDNHYLLGLASYARSTDARSHWVLPLYYYSSDADSKLLFTLPWWSKEQADGSGFHSLMPLYFYRYTADSSGFYSPVWMAETQEDGSRWRAAFPFYYGAESNEGSVMITPLYAGKKHADGSPAWRCYIPFIYFNSDYDAHFMTALGGYWKMGDQKNWLALPLLSGGQKDDVSGRYILFGGLAAKRWDEAGSASHIFPLYYRSPQNNMFISAPYATWESGGRARHVIAPLLSGWSTDDESTRAILAAGLAGFRKGGSDPYSYVLPLYYAAPKDQSFLSLPYSTWKTKSGQKHLVLPLLSGWNISSERTQALVAGGLVGWEKNQKTDQLDWSHLLPLYLWERDELFYTLLFGKDPKRSYFATPLIGSYNEESGKTGSWVFPFYRHKRDLDSGAVNGSYLLLGEYGKNENRTYHSFSGVYDYRHSKSRREKTFGEHNYVGFIKPGLRPAQATELGEVGDSLSIEEESTYLDYFIGTFDEQWTRTVNLDQGTNTVAELHSKKNSIFPLWESDLSEDLVNGQSLKTTSLLGILYDTRREEGDPENPDHEYVRKRVLWRLFHYEKLNGDKSTDIFPAVTLDSYKNGYRKASFLWRLFRYEKNPETGSKKLDLFFIPIKR
ncbi:MAG: hypothetical protein GXY61_07055 [Lentisphaerae bacterium]|nr:hypothetical protein [Lentisphaerota bacterium]